MNEIDTNKCISDILKYYIDAMNIPVEDYATKKRRLKLPIIPEPILCSLLEIIIDTFKEEPILLNTSSPCVIVGDIHGQLLDLFRILKSFPLPPETKYIFLGDLVDRGQFSTETVTLVFILKILYPQNIFIIRGNHEFGEISQKSDFFSELTSIYSNNSPLPKLFEDSFSQMPLSAIIDNEVILIHGGIGPSINDIESITSITKPILDYTDERVSDLLWSDPSDSISMFMPSNRGTGNIFGPSAINSFLSASKLKCLIRGHQCIENGCQSEINGKVITVFSASNYCGVTNNKSGVLVIDQNLSSLKQNSLQKTGYIPKTGSAGSKSHRPSLETSFISSYQIKTFGPLPQFLRTDVAFVKSESEYAFSVPQHSVSSMMHKKSQKLPRITSSSPICGKMGLTAKTTQMTFAETPGNFMSTISKQPKNKNKAQQNIPLPPPSYLKSLSANSLLGNKPNPRRKSSQIANSFVPRISY